MDMDMDMDMYIDCMINAGDALSPCKTYEMQMRINVLAPERYCNNFKSMILKLITE